MSLAIVFTVVALFITCVASCMYIIIMGPSRYHRDGYVGKAYQKLTDCPNICGGCFCGLFFGCSYKRGRKNWLRCAEHALHERNYFIVVFYGLLVWSVEFLYIFFALPKLRASVLSKTVSVMLVIASECFYALAMFSDPGVVTSRNEQEAQRLAYSKQKGKLSKHAKKRPDHDASNDRPNRNNRNNNNNNSSSSNGSKLITTNPRRFLLSPEAEARQNKLYPVDGILFAIASSNSPTAAAPYVKGTDLGLDCTTCCIPRPSRSKHCRLCDCCVRRYDHHCPWINNDVAEGTLRWFLLFLLCHAISCTWSSWDLYVIVRDFLVANNAWGWVLRINHSRVYELHLVDYLAIIVSHQPLVAGLFLFAVMIGFVLWAFWAYQMSFVMTNLTSNDMNKIDEAVEFITHLQTLDDVHREAMNVRLRLEAIAAKPPKRLQALTPPPEGATPGSRADKKYRKTVRNALNGDLRGIYDRGIWKNTMEVMFPYS